MQVLLCYYNVTNICQYFTSESFQLDKIPQHTPLSKCALNLETFSITKIPYLSNCLHCWSTQGVHPSCKVFEKLNNFSNLGICIETILSSQSTSAHHEK